MSVKIMGLVWDADLDKDTKIILLAYADHADHEGGGVYPGVPLIAWKTGYSDRQVQRITHSLVAMKIMIPTGVSQFGTNIYRIDPRAFPKRDAYQPAKRGRPLVTVESAPGQPAPTQLPVVNGLVPACEEPEEPKLGDMVSPNYQEIGDTMSPNLQKMGDIHDKMGDIAMSPKPSLTAIKPPNQPSLTEPDLKTIWGKVLQDVWSNTVLNGPTNGVNSVAKNNWERLRRGRLVGLNGRAVIVAPDDAERDWLNSRYAKIVERSFAGVIGQATPVVFVNMSQAQEYATL